jgi:hypothetical protein
MKDEKSWFMICSAAEDVCVCLDEEKNDETERGDGDGQEYGQEEEEQTETFVPESSSFLSEEHKSLLEQRRRELESAGRSRAESEESLAILQSPFLLSPALTWTSHMEPSLSLVLQVVMHNIYILTHH